MMKTWLRWMASALVLLGAAGCASSMGTRPDVAPASSSEIDNQPSVSPAEPSRGRGQSYQAP